MLRTCIIGLGPIGNRHADIHVPDQNAELVGVCDIRRDRADAASERLGVPAFYDAPTMLRDLRPDLCSVATGGYEYSSDHHEPTMQALEAGAHVLLEKPISNDLAHAREMVDLARERNRCFGIDFNHRFTPAAIEAKRWIEEGRLGTLLFANMALWIGNPAESSPYYHLKALHPHSIDMLRYYLGDIKAVQCFAMKGPGRTIWSTAHMNFEFECGAVGGLTGSYDIARGHPMERCEVAGSGARFVLEDMWREVTLYPADSWDKTVYTNPVFGGYRDFGDTFSARIHKFIEQVANGVDPSEIDGSGLDGLKAQTVIHAAIESLETRRVVEIAEMEA